MRAMLVLVPILLLAAVLAHFLHQKHSASAYNHAGKQIQFSGKEHTILLKTNYFYYILVAPLKTRHCDNLNSVAAQQR